MCSPELGTDRRGKIWGGLVPYGWHEDNFGACGKQCSWRGGANENTVFTTSHDLQVEGQPLPAGRYGLFFVPGESEWTVIFSKNSTSWGHYFYDAAEDALRVTVKPGTTTAPSRSTRRAPEKSMMMFLPGSTCSMRRLRPM